MELRFQMNDILPLLPIPQPPTGRSSYNIPVRSVTMQDQESGILISTSSAMCSDAPNAASLKAVSLTSTPTILVYLGIKCARI